MSTFFFCHTRMAILKGRMIKKEKKVSDANSKTIARPNKHSHSHPSIPQKQFSIMNHHHRTYVRSPNIRQRGKNIISIRSTNSALEVLLKVTLKNTYNHTGERLLYTFLQESSPNYLAIVVPFDLLFWSWIHRVGLLGLLKEARTNLALEK